jgi:hypothetical protein
LPALLCALLASCHAGRAEPVRFGPHHRPADLAELLGRSSWVTGDLTFPFDRVLDTSRPQPEKAFGRLRLDASDIDGEVKVRSFGNFSRLVCAFPKLILEVGDMEPPSAYDSVFLITHCNDASAAIGGLPTEEQVAIHETAYRMARVIGLAALRTRLARLTFVDSSQGAGSRTHDAFFLEHARDLARRLTGEATAYTGPGDPVELTSYHDLDPHAAAVFHLFQIMINNRDWELLRLLPVCRAINRQHEPDVPRIHNAFVIHPPGERPLPVPFDFEISSFVGVPEAVAVLTDEDFHDTLARVATPVLLPDGSPLLRWMVVRLQHFRLSHDPGVVARAVAEMKSNQERFEAVVRSAILSPEAEARAGEHLSAFYTALQPLLFELPRVGPEDSELWRDQTLRRVECPRIPAGTPVQIVREHGDVVRVHLLQRFTVRGRKVSPVCSGRILDHPGWLPAERIQR